MLRRKKGDDTLKISTDRRSGKGFGGGGRRR
jgi:hypothetical protein